MNSNQEFEKGLRQSGMRVTKPRKAIYGFMRHNRDHPTAHEIYTNLKQAYPSLSLATVYNTLEVLVAHGLVQDLGSAFDDEIHYDGEMSPHINLICTNCHSISDHPMSNQEDLPNLITIKTGFKVSGIRIVYYGRCISCLSKF